MLQAQPIPSLQGGVEGLKVAHSSAGTRGRDWTAEELEGRTIIAVFGGSTTCDIAVGDGETWPDQLEQRLDSAAVINHGGPGYSTVENLLQTAFYADAFGRAPIARSTTSAGTISRAQVSTISTAPMPSGTCAARSTP